MPIFRNADEYNQAASNIDRTICMPQGLAWTEAGVVERFGPAYGLTYSQTCRLVTAHLPPWPDPDLDKFSGSDSCPLWVIVWRTESHIYRELYGYKGDGRLVHSDCMLGGAYVTETANRRSTLRLGFYDYDRKSFSTSMWLRAKHCSCDYVNGWHLPRGMTHG